MGHPPLFETTATALALACLCAKVRTVGPLDSFFPYETCVLLPLALAGKLGITLELFDSITTPPIAGEMIAAFDVLVGIVYPN